MEKKMETITIPRREYQILKIMERHSIELCEEIYKLYTNEDYPSKKYLKIVKL